MGRPSSSAGSKGLSTVHANLAIGREIPEQTHGLRDARAFIVDRVPFVGRGQSDLLFGQAGAQEAEHAGKAGGIDAQAEADATRVQRGW